jgi:hypothetical protein
LGGAAAAEGQDAINALAMGGSSCGFDRGRSRPAKIIKGTKNRLHNRMGKAVKMHEFVMGWFSDF